MVQCSRHDTPPAVILLAELSGHDLVLELEARGNGVLTDRWLGDQPAFSDETDPVPLGSDLALLWCDSARKPRGWRKEAIQ
jgi:hypothetical protein